MEIYTYFEIPEGQAVFHMCGEPTETRHVVMHNYDAVISPSWSCLLYTSDVYKRQSITRRFSHA